MKNLKKIKGDASFRKFFRKGIENDKSSVIVFAKKEKFKNLVIYDSINKILIKNLAISSIQIKMILCDLNEIITIPKAN